jgi:hypothetical protein
VAKLDVTPEQLAEILGELPPDQLKMVLAKVADRLEVREWMRLGESGLREWLNEPDLYPLCRRAPSLVMSSSSDRYSSRARPRGGRNHFEKPPGECL